MFPCETNVSLDHFESRPLRLAKRKEDISRVEKKRKKIYAA